MLVVVAGIMGMLRALPVLSLPLARALVSTSDCGRNARSFVCQILYTKVSRFGELLTKKKGKGSPSSTWFACIKEAKVQEKHSVTSFARVKLKNFTFVDSYRRRRCLDK